MFYGIYLSADGAHTQAKRLEVIASNLANVDTPGFRRQLAILQSRPSEAVAQSLSEPGSGGLDDLAGGVRISHTAIDATAGKVKPTGLPTDFAIAGDGYFAVQQDGQVFLTRAGNFSINAAGQLVAQLASGEYPVLSQAGQPIVIDPTLGPWELTPSGAIRQGAMIQPLALLRPGEGAPAYPSRGKSLPGGGAARTGSRTRSPGPQGYLEQSAVEPTTEMVELIEASRAHRG